MSVFVNRLLSKTGKDMFVQIYSFNATNSKFIDDALFLKKDFYNCYLSNDGSFVIYNKNIATNASSEKTTIEYINKLTKKPVIVSSGIKPLSLNLSVPNQKYFFSLNSKWILYRDPSSPVIYSILYNTIHFVDFKNYYSISGNESSSTILFNKYCKEVSNLDDACACFNFDDNPACLYDLLGKTDTDALKSKKDTASLQLYNTLSSGCACVNQKCTVFNKQNADSKSFIPFYINKNMNNCNQDFILTYCNSSITAGRDLSAEGKVSVNQACSASGVNLPANGGTSGGSSGGGTTGGGTGGGTTTNNTNTTNTTNNTTTNTTNTGGDTGNGDKTQISIGLTDDFNKLTDTQKYIVVGVGILLFTILLFMLIRLLKGQNRNTSTE